MIKVSKEQVKVLSGVVVGGSIVANILVYGGMVTPRSPEAWIIGGILMLLLAVLAYASFTSRSDS